MKLFTMSKKKYRQKTFDKYVHEKKTSVSRVKFHSTVMYHPVILSYYIFKYIQIYILRKSKHIEYLCI